MEIDLKWTGPNTLIDYADDQSFAWVSNNKCGLYTQIIRDSSGIVKSIYFGRHSSSVSKRQEEHIVNFLKGIYNLYSPDGTLIHFPNSKGLHSDIPFIGNADEILLKALMHINRVEVYTAVVEHPIRNNAPSDLISHIEPIIIEFLETLKTSIDVQNYRKPDPKHRVFGEYKVNHLDSDTIKSLFGSSTIWKRQSGVSSQP